MIEAKKLTSESVALNGIASMYKSKTHQADSSSFEKVFKKADENVQANRKDFSTKTRTNDYSSKRKEAPSKPDSPKQTEQTKGQAEGADNSKVQESNKVKEEPTPKSTEEQAKDDTQLIKKLSEELSVPEEKIIQILELLNISAPELEDKTKLNNFLTELFGVQDNLELLNVPDIKQIQQTINQVVEDYRDIPDTTISNTEEKSSISELPPEVENKPNQNENLNAATTAQASTKPEAQTIGPQVETLPKDTEAPKAKGNASTETELPKEIPTEQKSLTGDSGSKKDDSGTNLLNREPGSEHMIMSNANSQAVANEKVQYAQSTARSSSAQNVNSEDVIEQIVNRMKVEVRGNVSEVRLTLRPENLGDVSLKISTENGIITAHFIAENQRIKEVIETNFNSLKDVLQQQGIEINNLSVSVGGNEQERMMHQFQQERQQSLARAEDIRNGVGGPDPEDEVIDEKELYESNVDFSA